MIHFENTEVAFSHKSDKDLRKAYFLFKMMASNCMVKFGKTMTNIAIKINFPIGWIFKSTIYSHFVGGETLTECDKNVNLLAQFNIKSILDYSVEGENTETEIEKTLDETIRSIKNAASQKNIAFAVFKPSAFALGNILEIATKKTELSETERKQLNIFEQHIDLLCNTAYKHDVSILIDAEDFAIQDIVDKVVLRMMEKYNKQKAIVYNTLQMYRWDRLDFLRSALELVKSRNFILAAKFVRGAYMEKERLLASNNGYKSPIHDTKENTDRDYNAALKFAVENIQNMSIFCGTHNEHSNRYLAQLMQENNIQKDDKRIFFAQLYGMSDHISFNLAKQGYNVAKYVPYGPVKLVMPYLMRRAEENTAVAGQTGRELMLIMKERNRRKNVQKKSIK